MKRIIFILIMFTVLISSCKKDNITPDPIKPSTKDVIADPNFDWKTTKEITLNVIGLKQVNPNISNVLQIKSSNGDTIYYKDIIKMNSDYTIKFAVPSTETKVILTYGTKTQTINLTSNSITFDYIIQ